MIGIGCGIVTDHLARSGVIGNGARPIWGMPASLATLDTAMVGGVVDEPMMMSALDSVTKRRALVVAVVGSPPSSSTITLSGTPPISLATNSSALRSGMPSAAAGPVVVIEMPMVISLVCASAGNPGRRERRRDHRGRQIEPLHCFLPVKCCCQSRSKFDW